METDFNNWLKANGYSEDVGAKKSCPVHGRRFSGVYNYKTWSYECLHCLKAEFETESSTRESEGATK